MPSATLPIAPGFLTFKKFVRNRAVPIETSVAELISLLKRRQVKGSRECARATAYLLRRVVESSKDDDVSKLIQRVQQVGQRLIAAQSKELAIGNIVRRVLGVIREEAEENRDQEAGSCGNNMTESRSSPLIEDASQRFMSPSRANGSVSSRHEDDAHGPVTAANNILQRHTSTNSTSALNPVASPISMFSLLSRSSTNTLPPQGTSVLPLPIRNSPPSTQTLAKHRNVKDLRAEVIEGIGEIVEELKQADDQIAGYALEHIHSNEVILTHTSSVTVQKFLLKAAAKRQFTVVHAEAYPNDHIASHATVMGKSKGDIDDHLTPESFQKSLNAAGITVILIPDSAVFALMSRVNKVILDTHVVLANGGLITAAGAKNITRAANVHRTPVIVLSGVYKLSPVYPFNIDILLEDGDPSKIIPYEDGNFIDRVQVENPLFDFVPADLVDLYITNLGGHAPSYLYRIVADHYRVEDINFDVINVDE